MLDRIRMKKYFFEFRQFLMVLVAVAMLVTTGPNLQNYLFSIIDPNSQSIYDSAFGGQLIHFPTLFDWLAGISSIPVLLVSLVVSISLVKINSPIKILIRSGLACFLSWCVIDIYIGLAHYNYDVNFYLQCLIANLTGAVIFSFFLLVFFEAAYLHIHSSKKIRQIDLMACELIFVLLAFLLLCLIYYISVFLFKPLPVKLQIYSAYPASGYLTKKEDSAIKDVSAKDILLPGNSMPSKFKVISVDGDFELQFDSNSNNQMYEVKLAFVEGCSELDQALEEVLPSSWNVYESVKNLNISLDSGTTDLFSNSAERNFINDHKENELQTLFWLELSEDEEGFEVTQFFSERINLKYESDPQPQYFLLSTYLLEKNESAVGPIARNINISIDENKYSQTFKINGEVLSSSEVICQSLSPRDYDINSDGLENTSLVDSPIAGVVVSIVPDFGDKVIRYFDKSIVSIEGGSGYRSIMDLDLEEMIYSRSDDINLFSISGNLKRFVKDGVEQQLSTSDRYTAIGEFSATYISGGWVSIEGRADFLWNRKSRLNPTRWEITDMGWGELVAIFGGILVLLGWILRKLIFPRLSDNKNIEWKVF
ncbi:hypothetical protein HXW73_07345 [Halomonas sp. SH5A2]|uniref:hypothetical protein n=1 Tax=Halomonas sp. SH5A2 TaxID=2749040 RepID=UPI0016412E0D|nr:hypothetical protein [Halomonas sp. SH5A2]QNI02766.1 hypothetical protein HXW73_07345 [Halomonas sp. SH5A2]